MATALTRARNRLEYYRKQAAELNQKVAMLEEQVRAMEETSRTFEMPETE